MIDLNELASQAYITAKKREKNGAFIHKIMKEFGGELIYMGFRLKHKTVRKYR